MNDTRAICSHCRAVLPTSAEAMRCFDGHAFIGRLRRIAEFADQHARPQPSVIVGDKVRIYSTYVYEDGTSTVAYNDVSTRQEARDVLGY